MRKKLTQFSLGGILKVTFVVAALFLLPINLPDLPMAEFVIRLIVLGVAAWMIPDIIIQRAGKFKRRN
jgi:hypothetical protein